MNRKELLRKRKRNRVRAIRRKIIGTSIWISAVILTMSFLLLNNSEAEGETFVEAANVVTLTTADEEEFIVCIDAGHGDWDIGAEGINGSYEKDINLDVALKLGSLLEKYDGIKVVYTRIDDTLSWSDNSTENLYERVRISEEAKADVFISLHCNSSYDSSNYRGIECWYNPASDKGYELAELIQDELSSLEYTLDRGVKTYIAGEELAVLEHNEAVSVLVELGFISNWSDESYLNSEMGQNQCAEAISNAILEYKEIKGL